jgi:hypothetical protein
MQILGNNVKAPDSFVKKSEKDYYNVFDRICEFIAQKKLDETYRDMLFDTIESNKEKFGTGTRFRNMVKVYGAWKDK